MTRDSPPRRDRDEGRPTPGSIRCPVGSVGGVGAGGVLMCRRPWWTAAVKRQTSTKFR